MAEWQLDCVGAMFHQSHFDWGQNRIRLGKCGTCGRFRESHSNGYLKVDSFTHALPDLPEPNSGIRTVNHAAEKAQPLGSIVAVAPDVILCDLGVQSEEAIHVPGLGEDVCSVAQLRGFDNDGFLNVENVFIPKQINPACPARDLAIEEWVIIRTPADLCDIKVTGKTQYGTHSLQFGFLDGPMLQVQTNLIKSLRVLTETVMARSSHVQLLLVIGREFDLQPARQCSLPTDEFPFPATFAVFASLYECAIYVDFRCK